MTAAEGVLALACIDYVRERFALTEDEARELDALEQRIGEIPADVAGAPLGKACLAWIRAHAATVSEPDAQGSGDSRLG